MSCSSLLAKCISTGNYYYNCIIDVSRDNIFLKKHTHTHTLKFKFFDSHMRSGQSVSVIGTAVRPYVYFVLKFRLASPVMVHTIVNRVSMVIVVLVIINLYLNLVIV
eukprot:SAG31_NODE_8573_length_1428_cov_1.352144_1_plen_107_part_00